MHQPRNPNPYDQDGSAYGNQNNPYAPSRAAGSEQPGGDTPTHELNIDQILRMSARLYRRYLPELLVPAVLLGGLLTLINYFIIMETSDWLVDFLVTLSDPEFVPDLDKLIESIQPFSSQLMGLTVGISVAQMSLTLFTVLRAGARLQHMDAAPDIGTTFQAFFGKLPFYLLLGFISWILIAFGGMLCVVPGLALLVFFAMLAPAVALGGHGFNALGECFRVLNNRFFKTFAVFVVCFALYYVFTILVSLLIQAAFPALNIEAMSETSSPEEAVEALRALMKSPAYHLAQLPANIASAVWYSFVAVASTVMYLNYSRASEQSSDFE